MRDGLFQDAKREDADVWALGAWGLVSEQVAESGRRPSGAAS